MFTRIARRTLLGGFLYVLCQPASLVAQDTGSAALVRRLSTLMAEHKLQAVGAQNPRQPDGFVAAMLFPGVQLLLVSGRPQSAAMAHSAVERRQYAELYSTLHQAVIPESKWFVQDMHADGLRSHDKDAVDIVYDRVTNQLTFDGAPSKRKIRDDDYAAQFATAEAKYSELLSILIETAEHETPAP